MAPNAGQFVVQLGRDFAVEAFRLGKGPACPNRESGSGVDDLDGHQAAGGAEGRLAGGLTSKQRSAAREHRRSRGRRYAVAQFAKS